MREGTYWSCKGHLIASVGIAMALLLMVMPTAAQDDWSSGENEGTAAPAEEAAPEEGAGGEAPAEGEVPAEGEPPAEGGAEVGAEAGVSLGGGGLEGGMDAGGGMEGEMVEEEVPPAEPAEEEAAPEEGEPDKDVEEIVVTGTRIGRNNLTLKIPGQAQRQGGLADGGRPDDDEERLVDPTVIPHKYQQTSV